MKYRCLRSCINRRVSKNEYYLQDCKLVIDGRSYFSNTYKKSGCKFILGGEYDRYANYLKNTLNYFIESKVTCYVVINGGMKADIERRKEILQNIIDNTDAVKPGEENAYSEPIFVKDVYKEVLEELGIKYYVTEYDSRKEIIDVARKFNCPVLTRNYEYCLYGLSCITPNSMTFSTETKSIACTMFEVQECRAAFSMKYYLMPIFMTLVDEDSLHFVKLQEITACRKKFPIPSVLRWVRRQSTENAIRTIMKNLKDDSERTAFTNSYEYNVNLYRYSWKSIAVIYFKRNNSFPLFRDDNMWFMKGVASGRIAIPYINLKNNATFSGSWLIVDKEKEDAMLPAMDIVKYAYGLLNDFQNEKITIIGRKFDKSSAWDIEGDFIKAISNEGLFERRYMGRNRTKSLSNEDLFRFFLDQALPGFNFNVLQSVPEDCWILIICLVYFSKMKRDFKLFAYSIMLSYVMLGPVSEKMGVIKRGNFEVTHNVIDEEVKDGTSIFASEDCVNATNKLMDIFYVANIKSIFDRKILHTLAEFQHCLQQMNYLNRLCGERTKCTIYHRTINATFVYNAYLKMDSHRPITYFENLLSRSPVLEYFKKIVRVFEDCILSVQPI